MNKAKKSSKAVKIPQPIKVKKEKTEEDRALYSMSHYIDDRLELIKQIFGSLKTKTITNLAPEYLKEKNMFETQSLCLEELLCLSKKRLLSIINATECPTDTESSDDSDIEAKEEHISLEEISSDSELEDGVKKTKKSKSLSRTKKNPKKPNQSAEANGNNDGQISVLELLELQARARAIRSQLALEPVTKIEVDSDDNANVSSTTKEQKVAPQRKKSAKTKSTDKSISSSSTLNSKQQQQQQQQEQSGPSTTTGVGVSSASRSVNQEPPTSNQRIKLKRNFRKVNNEVTIPSSSCAENQQSNSTISKSVQNNVKKERKSRSVSPDVIPIEPVAETLLIIDSSSDDDEVVQKSSIDEKPADETAAIVTTPLQQPIAHEEAEDGEIVENESEIKSQTSSKVLTIVDNNNGDPIVKALSSNDEILIEDKEKISDVIELSKQNDTSAAEDAQEAIVPTNDEGNERSTGIVQADCNHDVDGDQNDDVISIEGGDLETEMSEHLDEDSKCSAISATKASKSFQETYEDDDIISLDSSDEDADESTANGDNTESWHARYLKSSKVSKVLAVSKLGKRVRDKLKTTKLSKKTTASNDTAASSHETENMEKHKFASKHEEGSVEQYKELLELTHRKT